MVKALEEANLAQPMLSTQQAVDLTCSVQRGTPVPGATQAPSNLLEKWKRICTTFGLDPSRGMPANIAEANAKLGLVPPHEGPASFLPGQIDAILRLLG